MAVRVIEDKCAQFGNRMEVILEADGPAELITPEARAAVLIFARRQGFPARGLNGTPQTYPVDAKGEVNDDVLKGKTPVAGYRADYQVNAGAGVF